MLKRETLTPELADVMIENAIGVFGIPLGIAVNLKLNDKDYLLPMAIEESSVVAGSQQCCPTDSRKRQDGRSGNGTNYDQSDPNR